MQQLADLYQHLLMYGQRKANRTGIDTIGIFGHQMRFCLQDGFPLATRKATPFKLIASELLWFLGGRQDDPGAIADLHTYNNHIWDEWVKPDGSFGPIYGVQWRRWLDTSLFHHGEGPMRPRTFEQQKRNGETCDVAVNGFDQIAHLLHTMKTNPESRRMLVTAWQPSEIDAMALPPCHVLFQVNCRPLTAGYAKVLSSRGQPPAKWIVDLQLYQRSCDSFLGVPFNVASYALLLHLLVHCCGPEYTVGDFVWTGGDVHLYANHIEQAREYLHRASLPLPRLWLNPDVRDIDAFTLADMRVDGYTHAGKLTAPVAV